MYFLAYFCIDINDILYINILYYIIIYLLVLRTGIYSTGINWYMLYLFIVVGVKKVAFIYY